MLYIYITVVNANASATGAADVKTKLNDKQDYVLSLCFSMMVDIKTCFQFPQPSNGTVFQHT